MAYNKHAWVAPQGANLNRFTKANETPQTVDLTPSPSLTNSPTSVSAEWLNEMEAGIESADAVATVAQSAAQAAENTASAAQTAADNAMTKAQIALETAQAAGGGGSVIPQGAAGHLATHSGTVGVFGTPKNPADFATPAAVNAKQDKVPAGAAGHLVTHSGKEGEFGTPVDPATLGGSGGGSDIPAETNGYLATHSGKIGVFGTGINSVGWQKSQVPASTNGHLITASGTAGTFGTARNPADLTGVTTAAPTAAYSGNGSRLVYLTSEPSTKYDGWIYLIKA